MINELTADICLADCVFSSRFPIPLPISADSGVAGDLVPICDPGLERVRRIGDDDPHLSHPRSETISQAIPCIASCRLRRLLIYEGPYCRLNRENYCAPPRVPSRTDETGPSEHSVCLSIIDSLILILFFKQTDARVQAVTESTCKTKLDSGEATNC